MNRSSDAYRLGALAEMGLMPLWIRRELTQDVPPVQTNAAMPGTKIPPAAARQAAQEIEDAAAVVAALPEADYLSLPVMPTTVESAWDDQVLSQGPTPGKPAAASKTRKTASFADPAASEARRIRIAAQGWDELRASVAACTECGLCQSRKQTVFGVGHENADWMLVGEAPGAEEDVRGEPFVGQAGRLLDNMLAAVGLARPADVFIANVLKCRPPGNRNPESLEMRQCEPFLLRQVELVQPKLLVLLGRFAAQSVLNTDASIASLRGRIHMIDVGGRKVPTIVTYHPAYLLRNLPDKAKSWADLCLAKETMAKLAA